MPEEQQTTEAVAEPKPEQTTEKTYTQKDIDSMMGGIKAEAQKKLLKELGIEDVSSAKEGLKKLKEMQDAQLSEAEKLKAQIAELEKAKAEAHSLAEAASAKFVAVAKGVPADKVDKVVKLAGSYDGETVEAKIDAVLADFPEIAKAPATPAPTFGTQTQAKTPNEAEKVSAELDKIFGLKK
ncbi:MAG TPA: hypothetical protein P5522_10785 [Spirochaetia bacterium]|nr:hypothetical protein [Spirochaetia bacterium]